MEVIGDQEKVLQDTRDVFDKTVAHFAIETSVSFEKHVKLYIDSAAQLQYYKC